MLTCRLKTAKGTKASISFLYASINIWLVPIVLNNSKGIFLLIQIYHNWNDKMRSKTGNHNILLWFNFRNVTYHFIASFLVILIHKLCAGAAMDCKVSETSVPFELE